MVSLHCDPSGLPAAQGEAGNAPPPPLPAFRESPRAPRAGDQRRQTGVGPPRPRALHPGGRGARLAPPAPRLPLAQRSARRRTAHLGTGRLPRPRSPTPSPLPALAPAPLPPDFPRRAPRCHLSEAPLFAREGPLPSPPPRDPGPGFKALATPRNRDGSPALPSSGTPPASARRPCAAARPDPARGRRRSRLPLAAKRSYCASASTNAGWTGVSFTQEDTWSRGGRGSGVWLVGTDAPGPGGERVPRRGRGRAPAGGRSLCRSAGVGGAYMPGTTPLVSMSVRLPLRFCSSSKALNRELKLPAPKPWWLWRWMTSRKSVGRSCTGLVKICRR